MLFYTSWDSVPEKTPPENHPRYLLQRSSLMYCTCGNKAEVQKGVGETIKAAERTAAEQIDVFVELSASENEKEILAVGSCLKDVF